MSERAEGARDRELVVLGVLSKLLHAGDMRIDKVDFDLTEAEMNEVPVLGPAVTFYFVSGPLDGVTAGRGYRLAVTEVEVAEDPF